MDACAFGLAVVVGRKEADKVAGMGGVRIDRIEGVGCFQHRLDLRLKRDVIAVPACNLAWEQDKAVAVRRDARGWRGQHKGGCDQYA